jgi:hypothetical protein
MLARKGSPSQHSAHRNGTWHLRNDGRLGQLLDVTSITRTSLFYEPVGNGVGSKTLSRSDTRKEDGRPASLRSAGDCARPQDALLVDGPLYGVMQLFVPLELVRSTGQLVCIEHLKTV